MDDAIILVPARGNEFPYGAGDEVWIRARVSNDWYPERNGALLEIEAPAGQRKNRAVVSYDQLYVAING